MNKKILEITENKNLLIISILDPLSSKLPPSVTSGWSSVGDVYELARKYCHRIHSKRDNVHGFGQHTLNSLLVFVNKFRELSSIT